MACQPLIDSKSTGLDDCPFPVIYHSFPDRVWIVTDGTKHGHYSIHRVGDFLACYSDKAGAERFAMMVLKIAGIGPVEVSFDEAREIAAGKGHPICGVALLDDLENPVLHYVR